MDQKINPKQDYLKKAEALYDSLRALSEPFRLFGAGQNIFDNPNYRMAACYYIATILESNISRVQIEESLVGLRYSKKLLESLAEKTHILEK